MIRFFDILFSFLGILFLSPVFLFLYIAIRLESKGGGFYSISKSPESAEQRAGRGQLFQYDNAAFIKLEQIIFFAALDRRHQICCKCEPSHIQSN